MLIVRMWYLPKETMTADNPDNSDKCMNQKLLVIVRQIKYKPSDNFKTRWEPNVKRDRRSLSESKASKEAEVPKAETFQPKRSGTEEARPSSRRLGKQEYLRRKHPIWSQCQNGTGAAIYVQGVYGSEST